MLVRKGPPAISLTPRTILTNDGGQPCRDACFFPLLLAEPPVTDTIAHQRGEFVPRRAHQTAQGRWRHRFYFATRLDLIAACVGAADEAINPALRRPKSASALFAALVCSELESGEAQSVCHKRVERIAAASPRCDVSVSESGEQPGADNRGEGVCTHSQRTVIRHSLSSHCDRRRGLMRRAVS